MPRTPKTWEPEARRYIADNLICPFCGNTNAFSIDLKIKHDLTMRPEGVEVGLSKVHTDKLTKAMAKNLWKILDKGFEDGNPKIICANCGESDGVDLHERLINVCWQTGCPGCWWCGEWMEKKDVIETCHNCIVDRLGKVDEDVCYNSCEHFESGLEQVQAHHGLTLEGLKRDMGY